MSLSNREGRNVPKKLFVPGECREKRRDTICWQVATAARTSFANTQMGCEGKAEGWPLLASVYGGVVRCGVFLLR